MSLQEVSIVVGMVSTLGPAMAVYLRRRSHTMVAAAGCVSVAVSIYLLCLLRVVQIGPANSPNLWVYGLVGSATLVLLAGYFFSR